MTETKVAALYENLIVISEQGAVVKELKLKYKANCFDFNSLTNEFLIGDSEVIF